VITEMEEHKETVAYDTGLGELIITTTYRSFFNAMTGQEMRREKICTELRADWLTEEMANEFAAWASTGYAGWMPAFLRGKTMTTHQIELKERLAQKSLADVEFPIYSEQDVTCGEGVGEYIIYSRVTFDEATKKMAKVEISVMGRHGITIEQINDYKFDGSDINYHLGRGSYESSKEDFDKALEKLRKLDAEVAAIQTKQEQ